MYYAFTIKELLQHIISFVPRNALIPCALVSKDFYNSLTIDYDQESVAKNGDMFSLLKINYSPIAVLHIATLNNNIDMVDYLLQKYDSDYFDDNDIFYQNIGFVGNEYLLDKIKDKYQYHISTAIIGMCKGGRIDLFEKYKDSYDICYMGDELLIAAYSSGCDEMANVVKKYMVDRTELFDDWIDDESQIEDAEITGKCAIKDPEYVRTFLQTIMADKKYNTKCIFGTYEHISTIADGLLLGGHYEIFMWLFETLDNPYYMCETNEYILRLVISNNYKMLAHALTNNCYRYLKCGRLVNVPDHGPEDPINFPELVMYCIDYKRIEMLIFMINLIKFNTKRYQSFLDKAKSLNFTDIVDILVSNSHLFENYSEHY